ncbi:hypothetical protein CISG_07796 [Coccidioides immitis RMSCC 3703]|uniref:Uncharacterized protein n=1 Tax=Coccidioides immitis RMSCC 3703 TaxID=454286 RepID=A0A0J8TZG6_COCIT|nr:hypothetical protein CISG_07796 [Coccidioides immitis RMSCC 3703]
MPPSLSHFWLTHSLNESILQVAPYNQTSPQDDSALRARHSRVRLQLSLRIRTRQGDRREGHPRLSLRVSQNITDSAAAARGSSSAMTAAHASAIDWLSTRRNTCPLSPYWVPY